MREKNKWTLLNFKDGSTSAKDTAELISLVNKAYQNTELGSFVKNTADVGKSDWNILDFDKDDDIDCTIFFRQPRQNDLWIGRPGKYGFGKIQGIGHKGTLDSKAHTITKLTTLLTVKGFWVEASGALEKVLRRSLSPVTDPFTLRVLYKDENISVGKNGSYERMINSRKCIETTFGIPILSSAANRYRIR